MQRDLKMGIPAEAMSVSPPAARPASSEVIVQRFAVPFEYPVHFTERAFDPANGILVRAIARLEPTRCHRVLAVLDGGIPPLRPGLVGEIESYMAAHGERLELAGEVVVVPGGEGAKKEPALIERLHGRMHDLGIDRQSFVLVVGGGAVQDMVGFAAATVHRGVRVVRVPSTVLAQNDSGVGVKNGINAFDTKNFLGVFAPPFAVIDDFDLLRTLSDRDVAAGIAEAVKVALIRNSVFFDWLEASAADLAAREPRALRVMIRRCAELHLRHIATCGDPFELGSSRPLDFGHWAAHRLETLSDGRLRHGEAVAIGMALDSRYSLERGLLPLEDLERITALLERLDLGLWDATLAEREPGGRRRVFRGLDDFREHLGGELTVSLLAGIGRAVEVHEIDRGLMERSIAWLEQRARR